MGINKGANANDRHIINGLKDLDIQDKNNSYILNKFGSGPLHEAAKSGDNLKVKALMEAGDNPNLQNQFGITPFMEAVIYNNLSTAEILLKGTSDTNKANPNIKNNEGKNCALIAASQSNLPMLKLLTKYGADVYAVSNNESTILHYAAIGITTKNEDWELIKWLLKEYKNLPLNSFNKHNLNVIGEFEQTDFSYAETYADIVWEYKEIDLLGDE